MLLWELGSFLSSALTLEFIGIHVSTLGPASCRPVSLIHTLFLLVFQYAAFNAFLPTQMLFQAGGGDPV